MKVRSWVQDSLSVHVTYNKKNCWGGVAVLTCSSSSYVWFNIACRSFLSSFNFSVADYLMFFYFAHLAFWMKNLTYEHEVVSLLLSQLSC